MDNRRKIILAVLVAIAVLLIGLFYWLMFGPKANPPAVNGNANNADVTINVEPVAPVPPPSPKRQEEEKEAPLGLRQVAATFAERYFSYSSDQPDKNLDDLKPLMTLKMQGTARSLIDSGRQTGDAPVFIGYSAKALNTQLVASDAEKAQVKVSLQRLQYSGDNAGPAVFYQEMVLQFVKIGSEWRVDSVVME